MYPALLFFCLLGTHIVELFVANGSKYEIEQAAPDYAKKLFNSAADQIFLRTGPVRLRALFFADAPDHIKSTITMLRCISGANLVLTIAFVAYIVAGITANFFSP
ncbi:hypothetical protein [Dyella silvatica]|uniref:hypothetical protein n=1 Tax=Dyella silvatica TaxID=2992128 RepID=UPI00225B97E3|nr:hypothetical protein [Dyella silvatica]